MKNSSIKDRQFKRILVIQTAFLGDAILSTSLVKALAELYPGSKIDILLIPRAVDVYADNPHINKIITYHKKGLPTKVSSFFKLLPELKKEKYEIAISLKVSLNISLLMLLSGIPIRLGYPRQKLLTHSINLPQRIPVYKRSHQLLKALTDREFVPQTEIFWDKDTENDVNEYLKIFPTLAYTTIAIAPGSVWATKRWLPEYYTELLHLLNRYYIQAVFIGSKEDRPLCTEIIENARLNAYNLAGKLSLKGSAALISKLPLLITNDSAPLHLANAVQTAVIAIFGPTVKEFGFYPYRPRDTVLEISLPCRPCSKHGGKKCPQGHFRCMKDIKPEHILEAVLNKFQERNEQKDNSPDRR